MFCTQAPVRHPARGSLRSGLSLLEVLFSIFIISVGMLGAAMLIVVGNQYAADANIKDRAAACGHAALQQVVARGMLAPKSWVVLPSAPGLSLYQPVVLDPLFLYANWSQNAARRFRMVIDVPRVSWVPIHGTSGWSLGQRQALADAIFRWQDDLVFDPPPGDANGRPLPITYRPPGGPALLPLEASEGQFSWMAVIQPAWSEVRSGIPLNQRRLWRVTVVVFARRNLAEPERRIPRASVRFFPPGNNLLLQGPPAEVQQHLLPDRWILLSVRHPAPGVPVFYQWYRIVSLAQIGGGNEWLLRLDGPRWPYAAGNGVVAATVVPDVVAVYDRTVAVDPEY